ncbi:hypothetical protein SAMN05216582_11656 [Selenomonas ruminantium]|uniref:Uncharacterized protein n=1 Tax=Selenomonas ruminantium TaxID=971 RepID=A0A1M6V558_SELRU|nr:hypothetical protein [Selenomonas ruminantium]SHK76446.1 hypothetical protein SAMN05216582_11656 [Selenomonas ruminantium]
MNVTDIKGTAGVTNIERAKDKGTDDFKGLFSGMVREKLDSITETLEEMNARQQEVKELRDQQHFTETVRHVMPDGTILVREYVDGRLDSSYRKKPHMKDIPDETQPLPRALDGTVLESQIKMKKVPAVRVFEDFAGQ